LISRGGRRHRQRAARRLESKEGPKAFKVHLDGYDMLDYFKKGGEGDGV